MNTPGRAVGAESDPGKRLRTLLAAAGLFTCSAVFLSVAPRSDLLSAVLRLEYLALGPVAVSAATAVRGRGLRRALVLTFALAAGFGIHLVGVGITGETPGLLFRVAWAGVVGVVTATALGIPGWSFGLGLRRLSADGRSGPF